MAKQVTILGFLKPYLAHHKLTLTIFLFTCILAALEQSLHAYFMKLVIDTVAKTPPAMLLSVIVWPAGFYVSINLYHNLVMRAYLYMCLNFYPKLKSKVLYDLFEYTSKHSVGFFQNNMAGDLADKIKDISETVEPLMRKFFEVFAARVLSPIIAVVFLFFISWEFSVVFLVWSLVFIFFTVKLSKPVLEKAQCYTKNKNTLAGKLVDVFTNIVTAKTFGQIHFEQEELSSSLETVKNSERQLGLVTLKTDFTQGLLTLLLLSTFMIILVCKRTENNVTPGDFAFILTLLITTLGHIYMLGQAVGDSLTTIGKFRQAINLLFLPHDITDKRGAFPLKITAGEIHFQDVAFHYIENNPVFSDLNIHVKQGERIGIVGSSGAGKSTLVNLLLRLVEPQSGSILIDKQDVSEVTLNSLRKEVTLVPQQVDLFHRSISDNIRYGKLDATEQEVITAAELAGCEDFIKLLPEGYSSLVGERGAKLSGGQKQRIAIARAYLKSSKILILDEITSALDSITEAYIQDALKKIMVGKTTIIIAHRLATLKQMDRILVLEHGKVVQDDSFANLLEQPGAFFELWKHQYFTDAEYYPSNRGGGKTGVFKVD